MVGAILEASPDETSVSSDLCGLGFKVAVFLSSWVDTLYIFWDSITHYKTKSVHFLGAYELSYYEAGFS